MTTKATAFLAAVFAVSAAYCDVSSANIVGYAGSDTTNGFRAAGLSFNAVGDTATKFKDIKVTGYTGEYKANQIYFQFLTAAGSKDGHSIVWKDYFYEGDPDDPDDPPMTYKGWYDMQTGVDVNEQELALGNGVWFYAPNNTYQIQSAGEVYTEPVPVVTRNGFKLLANPCPRAIKFGEICVKGYTGEYKANQIYFQFLTVAGSKDGHSIVWKDYFYEGDPDDPDDPPMTYHGWYDMQTGADANETELPLGKGIWFYAPNGTYTVEFPGALDD